MARIWTNGEPINGASASASMRQSVRYQGKFSAPIFAVDISNFETDTIL